MTLCEPRVFVALRDWLSGLCFSIRPFLRSPSARLPASFGSGGAQALEDARSYTGVRGVGAPVLSLEGEGSL